mmetsp:Transcript_25182/g.29814  ORF Transcript_25182/g.29814 Transcript_25182/m.29814 type:complete len:122 (-) Transcript_25182:684-1049(-)
MSSSKSGRENLVVLSLATITKKNGIKYILRDSIMHHPHKKALNHYNLFINNPRSLNVCRGHVLYLQNNILNLLDQENMDILRDNSCKGVTINIDCNNVIRRSNQVYCRINLDFCMHASLFS